MMTVPVTVGKSEIHGIGVFALANIRKGQVVWMFTPGVDSKLSDYTVKYSEPRVQAFVLLRGYHNQARNTWVLCGDEASYWNFPRNGDQANCMMGAEQDSEKIVLAARDIQAGEELTIPPESDS